VLEVPDGLQRDTTAPDARRSHASNTTAHKPPVNAKEACTTQRSPWIWRRRMPTLSLWASARCPILIDRKRHKHIIVTEAIRASDAYLPGRPEALRVRTVSWPRIWRPSRLPKVQASFTASPSSISPSVPGNAIEQVTSAESLVTGTTSRLMLAARLTGWYSFPSRFRHAPSPGSAKVCSPVQGRRSSQPRIALSATPRIISANAWASSAQLVCPVGKTCNDEPRIPAASSSACARLLATSC
jgi:hypothetical protein